MLEIQTEIIRPALYVIAAGVLATACAAPERNGSGMLPTPLPMPARPELEFKKMRCFAPGLAHPISVDPEGNEYVAGNAIEDKSCLTSPQITPTPTP